jgi:hypothetical protein
MTENNHLAKSCIWFCGSKGLVQTANKRKEYKLQAFETVYAVYVRWRGTPFVNKEYNKKSDHPTPLSVEMKNYLHGVYRDKRNITLLHSLYNIREW